MGWEYAVIIKEKNYTDIADKLYQHFLLQYKQYKYVKETTGFSMLGNNTKWLEVLQVNINTANKMEYILPDGEPYLYFLFHIGGMQGAEFKKFILSVLDNLCTYRFEEL